MQFLQAAVQVFKMKFVAMLLGPAGLGVISLINQFVQLVVQVSTLALPWAATRFMAVANSRGRDFFEREIKVFFRGIFYLSSLGMAFAALLIWKYDYFLASDFQTYRFLALISVSMVVPLALKGFLLSVFTTAGKYRLSAVIMFWNAALGAGAVLAGAYLAGLQGFFGAQAIVEYATLFYCLVKMVNELGVRPFSGQVKVWEGLKSLEGSFKLVFYGSILYFMSPSALLAVRFSLLKAGGEQLVGLYQAVHGLVLYIAFAFSQATSLYLDPILKSEMPLEEKLALTGQYLRKVCLTVSSLMILVTVFPELFLQLLYSKAFIAGAGFLFAFMLIEALNLVAGVYVGLLVGQGWYNTHFILGLAVHGSVGIGSLLLAPHIGIWGVVAAMAFGSVISILIIFGRIFLHNRRYLVLKTFSLPALMLGSLAVTGGFFAFRQHDPGWYPELFSTRIGVILLFWIMTWLVLSKDEKNSFFAFIGSLKSRARL